MKLADMSNNATISNNARDGGGRSRTVQLAHVVFGIVASDISATGANLSRTIYGSESSAELLWSALQLLQCLVRGSWQDVGALISVYSSGAEMIAVLAEAAFTTVYKLIQAGDLEGVSTEAVRGSMQTAGECIQAVVAILRTPTLSDKYFGFNAPFTASVWFEIYSSCEYFILI